MQEDLPPIGRAPLSAYLRLQRGESEAVLYTLPHCACCGQPARLTAWMKLHLVREARKQGAGNGPTGCSDIGPGIPDSDGCLIALLAFGGVVLLMLLVRLIRRLGGWSRPATPETRSLDSEPAFVWLRLPVCLWHWCFRPGGIRLVRCGEHTIDLSGVSFAFIKDCKNAGLRILDDPDLPAKPDAPGDGHEQAAGRNESASDHP